MHIPTFTFQVMYFKFFIGTSPLAITHQRSDLSIVGQRWPLEARPASPASLLDRFFFYDAGGAGR